jgi:hypothetical protein
MTIDKLKWIPKMSASGHEIHIWIHKDYQEEIIINLVRNCNF